MAVVDVGPSAARGLSLALITIGSWEAGESNLFDSPTLEEHLRRRATRAGTVAEFCGHLLDENGSPVMQEVTAHCLTVPLPRLLGARERVVVIARPERSRALAAALRAGMVDTLVIIEGAARRLLEGETDVDP